MKNTIRIDVLEYNEKNDTVCVYDIKTGRRGLSLPRMIEIAREAFTAFDAGYANHCHRGAALSILRLIVAAEKENARGQA